MMYSDIIFWYYLIPERMEAPWIEYPQSSLAQIPCRRRNPSPPQEDWGTPHQTWWDCWRPWVHQGSHAGPDWALWETPMGLEWILQAILTDLHVYISTLGQPLTSIVNTHLNNPIKNTCRTIWFYLLFVKNHHRELLFVFGSDREKWIRKVMSKRHGSNTNQDPWRERIL